jgi:hypothetical protein
MAVLLSYIGGAGAQFFDNNGNPLAGGLLYVYQAGSTTPVTTFTSSAGNIQNSNPVVLDSAGRVPEEIWIAEGALYKFVLRTSASALIWEKDNIPVINDFTNAVASVLADLANTANIAKGDALIGFKQANSSGLLTGAVGKTVHDKLTECVSVFDFMTPEEIADVRSGALAINVAPKINLAFAASNAVLFPSGTYWCGEIANGNTYFDLTNKGPGVAILTQGFVELVGRTTTVSECQFFRLLPGANGAQSHFYCDPIRFRDLGYVSATLQGCIGFLIENNNSNWGNLRFIGIYGRDIVSAINVTNRDNTDIANNRIRGIFIDEIFVDNGNRGIVLAGQGDGVYVKKIVTSQVQRSLFAYNVMDVEASVFARNQKSTSGVINLGWFTQVTNGPPLQGIKVRYFTRSCSTLVNHVLINVIGPNLGAIRGIDLTLDIADEIGGNKAVDFIAYTMSGGVPDPTALANVMTDVLIRGRVGSQTNIIDSQANFTSPQSMTLLSTNIPVAANVYNNFAFTTVRTYVPAWTGSISSPVLGDGTLTGEYFIANGMCQVTVTLTVGSTTTFGSGPWFFTLPITCRSIATQYGSALALDAGTLYYVGTTDAAGTVLSATFDQTNTQAQSNVPFTWASGDSLSMTVSYPI